MFKKVIIGILAILYLVIFAFAIGWLTINANANNEIKDNCQSCDGHSFNFIVCDSYDKNNNTECLSKNCYSSCLLYYTPSQKVCAKFSCKITNDVGAPTALVVILSCIFPFYLIYIISVIHSVCCTSTTNNINSEPVQTAEFEMSKNTTVQSENSSSEISKNELEISVSQS